MKTTHLGSLLLGLAGLVATLYAPGDANSEPVDDSSLDELVGMFGGDPAGEAQRIVARDLRTGDPVPLFKAETIDGEPFALEDLKGHVVLLDFWATWCGPCVKEIPTIKRMVRHFRDDGFKVVGISLDKDLDRLRRTLEKQDITWPQICDGKGWRAELAQQFGIRGIPTAILLDRDLRVVTPRARGTRLVRELARLYDKPVPTEAEEGQKHGGEASDEDLLSRHSRLIRQPDGRVAADEVGHAILQRHADDAGALNRFAWRILGGNNLVHRNLDQAMQAAKRAYELSEGNNADIADTYARAFYERGDMENAVRYQTVAASLEAGNEDFQQRLAIFRRRAGLDTEEPPRVQWAPESPVAGDTLRILYSPAGSLPADASALFLHLGFNRWEPEMILHEPMERREDGTWQYEFRVPVHASRVDFVFADGAWRDSDTRWDNNSNLDWHIDTQGATLSTPRIAELSAQVWKHPEDPQPLKERGFALGRAGAYAHALRDYRKAISLAPRSVSVRWSFGWTLYGADQPLEALDQWGKAIAWSRDPPWWRHHTLALGHWAAGHTEQALRHYDDAATAYPDRFAAWDNLVDYTSFWSWKEKNGIYAVFDAWNRAYRKQN